MVGVKDIIVVEVIIIMSSIKWFLIKQELEGSHPF